MSQPALCRNNVILDILDALDRETKMDARFHADLVRIIGSRKCSQEVIRVLGNLTSGQSAYLDGVTLEMLQALLPIAVSKSVHQSIRQCETS